MNRELSNKRLFFLLYVPRSPDDISSPYSHSIVPGGLEVTS